MTSRHPALAADILELFRQRGTDLVDVPVIQPADPFLDMAGEDLRRRIFLTENEIGESLCLRPEFTIPVCLDHIRSRSGTPRRYAYLGEVFRQRREESNEFFQAGIEDLGDAETGQADARSLADACALLNLVLPGAGLTVTLGDQAMFEAVLASLGLPRGWQKRLARAFGAPDLLHSALADLAQPPDRASLSGPLDALIRDRDPDGLAAYVAGRMKAVGMSASLGRTPQEIARRLIEKAELRTTILSQQALEALRAFLAIRVPLEHATERLRSFAGAAGLDLDAALADFAERARAIAAYPAHAAAFSYDAAFGRPLDYYTGLVFEITSGSHRLVGGGRYDRLLTLLGAPHPIPGVGFSVWLDRVEKLRTQP